MLTSVHHFNQLGQMFLQRNSDETSGVRAMTGTAGVLTYSTERMELTVGRFALVSNPFTDPAAETMGWKLIKYDKFGRTKQVSFYRGASKPSPFGGNTNKSGDVIYAYSGDTTSVTDEAGNVRTTVADALGRILSASGGGTATATYIHNALDNLTGVTQIDPSTYGSSKTQTRTFGYSSLGQLLSAANPETTVASTYTYFNNGALKKRTDGRGTVTYEVDGLNR